MTTKKPINPKGNPKGNTRNDYYADETKEKALAMILSETKTISEAARELGIPRTTVFNWLEKSKTDPTYLGINNYLMQLRQSKREEFIHQAWDIVNLYLEKIARPDSIEKVSVSQAAMIVGLLLDKLTRLSGDINPDGNSESIERTLSIILKEKNITNTQNEEEDFKWKS